MLHLRTFAALTAALLLAGCAVTDANDRDAAPLQPFEIHLQSTFEGEHVEVALDGEVVFSGAATTDPRIGLATRFEVGRPVGTHVLRVTVGGDAQATQVFTLTRMLYLGVEYHRDGLPPQFPPGVSILVSEEPFYYF